MRYDRSIAPPLRELGLVRPPSSMSVAATRTIHFSVEDVDTPVGSQLQRSEARPPIVTGNPRCVPPDRRRRARYGVTGRPAGLPRQSTATRALGLLAVAYEVL